MNCKSGDLAVVVKSGGYCECDCCGERQETLRLGTIVRVVRLDSEGYWLLEDPVLRSYIFKCGAYVIAGEVTSISDEFLMPLRGDPEPETDIVEREREVSA